MIKSFNGKKVCTKSHKFNPEMQNFTTQGGSAPLQPSPEPLPPPPHFCQTPLLLTGYERLREGLSRINEMAHFHRLIIILKNNT